MIAVAKVVLLIVTMVIAVADVVLVFLTLVLATHVPLVVMQEAEVVAADIVLLGKSMLRPLQDSAMLRPLEQWRNLVQAILMAE